MEELETAPVYHYNSDYGLVNCTVLSIDSGDARIMLLETRRPLGDKGDCSWVPSDDVLPTE